MFGAVCQCAADAADSFKRRLRLVTAQHPFPEQAQRKFQQRQRAHIAVSFSNQALDEFRREPIPGKFRRLLDDVAQIRPRHDWHKHVAVDNRVVEGRKGLRLFEKIAAQGENCGNDGKFDGDGIHQILKKRCPFNVVIAKRIDFLALIRDKNHRLFPQFRRLSNHVAQSIPFALRIRLFKPRFATMHRLRRMLFRFEQARQGVCEAEQRMSAAREYDNARRVVLRERMLFKARNQASAND